MAVMDIRETFIEQAQQKVRHGTKHESLIDKDEGVAKDRHKFNLEECFDYFEIDYEYYSSNLECFVNLNQVPDTNTGLIATAFLVDFFEICGEQEVIIYCYYMNCYYNNIYN